MKLDDVAIIAANRTTEAGALTGVLGWFSQINWIGWAGVLIASFGLVANLYYQRRRDRREREQHASPRQSSTPLTVHWSYHNDNGSI